MGKPFLGRSSSPIPYDRSKPSLSRALSLDDHDKKNQGTFSVTRANPNAYDLLSILDSFCAEIDTIVTRHEQDEYLITDPQPVYFKLKP
jgi:hypothetical protein